MGERAGTLAGAGAACGAGPAPMAVVVVTGTVSLEATIPLPRSELSATPAGAMFSGRAEVSGADEALPVSMVPVVACKVPAAGLSNPTPGLPAGAGAAPELSVVTMLIDDVAGVNTVVLTAELVVLLARLVVATGGAGTTGVANVTAAGGGPGMIGASGVGVDGNEPMAPNALTVPMVVAPTGPVAPTCWAAQGSAKKAPERTAAAQAVRVIAGFMRRWWAGRAWLKRRRSQHVFVRLRLRPLDLECARPSSASGRCRRT